MERETLSIVCDAEFFFQFVCVVSVALFRATTLIGRRIGGEFQQNPSHSRHIDVSSFRLLLTAIRI